MGYHGDIGTNALANSINAYNHEYLIGKEHNSNVNNNIDMNIHIHIVWNFSSVQSEYL